MKYNQEVYSLVARGLFEAMIFWPIGENPLEVRAEVIDKLRGHFIRLFKEDNSNFDRDKFLRACGGEDYSPPKGS